jgi:hypothetical protein
VTWPQALGLRLRRQYLTAPFEADAVSVARRLSGVQAQVPAAAALAVALRAPDPSTGSLRDALDRRALFRTWAMRGTLHLLAPDDAADVLAVLAQARSWHKGAWQRTFATAETVDRLAGTVVDALAAGPLTRLQLAEAVRDRTGDDALADAVGSGWSMVLKPLAWQGLLCQGPAQGRSVTFARPDLLVPGWPGLAEPDEAGPRVVRAYLRAYGPATPEAFDQWLLRGAVPKRRVRSWFAALADEVVPVRVGDRSALLLADDLDELTGGSPLGPQDVTFVGPFDGWLLGPGTADDAVVPPEHRAVVSRRNGWIAASVLVAGRVAGTWEADVGTVDVTPLPGVRLPSGAAYEAAAERANAAVRGVPAGGAQVQEE